MRLLGDDSFRPSQPLTRRTRCCHDSTQIQMQMRIDGRKEIQKPPHANTVLPTLELLHAMLFFLFLLSPIGISRWSACGLRRRMRWIWDTPEVDDCSKRRRDETQTQLSQKKSAELFSVPWGTIKGQSIKSIDITLAFSTNTILRS